MSEENVEVVRKVLDAVNRGDMDAWLGFLSPEVVWESLPLVGFRDVYRGRAEAREWIEQLLEDFEEVHLEIEEITALSDDRVLIVSRATGRGRGSGVPVERPSCEISWLADGLILEIWLEGIRHQGPVLSQKLLVPERRRPVQLRIKNTAHDLDVLFRHRPRSISPRRGIAESTSARRRRVEWDPKNVEPRHSPNRMPIRKGRR